MDPEKRITIARDLIFFDEKQNRRVKDLLKMGGNGNETKPNKKCK